MSESTPVMERQACFQFRASFSPCTILQLTRYDLEGLAEQLSVAINKAPNFFIGSPVVIDLEAVNTVTEIDFEKLKQVIIANNMVPVGVRGGSPEQHIMAVTVGMPAVAIGKSKSSTSENQDVQSVSEAQDKDIKKSPSSPITQPAKVVTTPIRSGMHIYARESDLIVVAPVSPGAELLADGNIHIYGPLRGRALAGVQGNVQARIFCRTLEAELVAIAGYYLVKEDLQNLPTHDSMVQIYLENEQVKIEAV